MFPVSISPTSIVSLWGGLSSAAWALAQAFVFSCTSSGSISNSLSFALASYSVVAWTNLTGWFFGIGAGT